MISVSSVQEYHTRIKMQLYYVKNEIIKNKKMLIFLFFFLLFCILGTLLSYYNILNINFFFDADNTRAYNDLMLIKDEFLHYRIKVHPLMLIIYQPILLFLNGIIHDTHLTLIIVQSFIGATSVLCIYSLMSHIIILEKFKIILTLIYGFSFSIILFSTIPETFLFAGIFIMLYCLYLFYLVDNKISISMKQNLILCFFGIVCFGITITNYCVYMIGLIYLYLEKYSINKDYKKMLMSFIKINFLNLIFIFVLTIIQHNVWQESPVFWSQLKSITDQSKEFEEINYMNFEISLNKIIIWIKQLFIFPFISSEPYLINNQSIKNIFFGNVTNTIKIFCIFFYSTFLLGIFHIKEIVNKKFILFILMVLFNIILHFIYGYTISFIYSPHFMFLYILILAYLLSSIKNKKIKDFAFALLLLSLIIMILSNLYQYYNLIVITRNFCGVSYSIINTIFKTIGLFIILFGISYFIYLILHKYVSIKIKANDLDNKLLVILWIYICLTISSCIFINFNYWRI